MIRASEMIYGLDGRALRVVDVVPTQDDSALYVGLLMVEPA